MDETQLAAKLRKKSAEDGRNEEVLSRLISNHESQRRALEEERKRDAAESRLLLNQAADVILKLKAEMKARDEEILSLNAQVAALSKDVEEYRNDLRTREVERSTQPGPPESETRSHGIQSSAGERAREKALQDCPSAGNRRSPADCSTDLHGDRGTHHSDSSRPLHEVSKLRAAPLQETLIDSQDTRERYNTQRDRTMEDNTGTNSHKSKDESAPEIRQRPQQYYTKGEMRTDVPVSHISRYSSAHRLRDKDQGANRYTTSSRDERDSTSSRSSKEYEHRERGKTREKAREKALPDSPSAGNRGSPEDRSKGLHGDRGTHHSASSRPLHEVSKRHAAPPQESLVHSRDTREAYDTKRDRTMADNTGGEKHEGNPAPPAEDVVMKLDDVLSDTEMGKPTREDLALAMAMQQEEIDKSRASNRREEDSESSSESETDESDGTPQAQGITSRLYSFVAGSTTPPAAREEKLRAGRDKWKKAYKKASMEAQQRHDQGYKYYMDCTALQRRVEMMDQEQKSTSSELARTKQLLSDAINLSEVRGKELKDARSGQGKQHGRGKP